MLSFYPFYANCLSVTMKIFQYWPGSRAERPIPLLRSPRGGGRGTPLCVLASRRWGPIYIASYTHTLGSWDDFFMKFYSR
jgi:hypothetical protein